MGWVRLGRAWRRSGAWCEFGTDCTDCGPQDLPLLLVDPRPPHDDPAAPDGPGTMLVPAARYTVSFLVSFDWRRWSVVRAGLQSYLQCFEPDCTVELRYHNNTTLRYTDTIQGGVIVEAVVTDTAINGSSTATVEQAVALCQKNKGTGLFKALAAIVEGSVTASAPRMVMVRTSSYAFLRLKMRRKMRLWAYFGASVQNSFWPRVSHRSKTVSHRSKTRGLTGPRAKNCQNMARPYFEATSVPNPKSPNISAGVSSSRPESIVASTKRSHPQGP